MLDKEYFITLGSVRKVHSSVFYPPPKDCKSGKDGPECLRNIVLLRFDAIPNVKPIDIPAAQMNIDGTNKSKFLFLHFVKPFWSLKNLFKPLKLIYLINWVIKQIRLKGWQSFKKVKKGLEIFFLVSISMF